SSHDAAVRREAAAVTTWIMQTAGLLAMAGMLAFGAACTERVHPPPPRFPFPGTKADRIVVDKSERRLTLYREGQPLKSYHASLGRSPVGPKEREGDGRTPEGEYIIDGRLPNSRYHLAL